MHPIVMGREYESHEMVDFLCQIPALTRVTPGVVCQANLFLVIVISTIDFTTRRYLTTSSTYSKCFDITVATATCENAWFVVCLDFCKRLLKTIGNAVCCISGRAKKRNVRLRDEIGISLAYPGEISHCNDVHELDVGNIYESIPINI